MTEQSSTTAFTVSSFLDGANAESVDQFSARHVSASVDAGCPGRALPQAIKG
jgi:hypothetical protein